jgi:hypothetical protein
MKHGYCGPHWEHPDLPVDHLIHDEDCAHPVEQRYSSSNSNSSPSKRGRKPKPKDKDNPSHDSGQGQQPKKRRRLSAAEAAPTKKQQSQTTPNEALFVLVGQPLVPIALALPHHYVAAPVAAAAAVPETDQEGTTTPTTTPTTGKKKYPRKHKLCQVPTCPRTVKKDGYCGPHGMDSEAPIGNPVNDEDTELERWTGHGKRGRKSITSGSSAHQSKAVNNKEPDTFDIYFPQLQAFKQEHGNLSVPCESNNALYHFMEQTRRKQVALKNGKTSRILTPDRIQKLDELGFEWAATREEDWDATFELLLEFKAEHGHCRVNTMRDGPLAKWVKRCRSSYFQQMQSIENGTTMNDRTRLLTLDRIQKLNCIGFEWRRWSQDPWDKRFQDLQEFKNEHGHFTVLRKQDMSLSSWVKTQRMGYKNFMNMLRTDNDRNMAARNNGGVVPPGLDAQYEEVSKKKPMLDAERIVKLQMIGFQWTVQEASYEDAWEKRFMELLQFKAEFGHTRVSRNYDENLQLGTWVKMQRRAMTKKIRGTGGDSLNDDRIRRLEEIEFEWRLKPLELDGMYVCMM